MATDTSTDILRALRQLISTRCGIAFPEGKVAWLHTKLADHLQVLGLKDLGAYFQMLSLEPARSEIWQEVFRRITTNETYFYRNAAQIKAFTEYLMPAAMERQRGKLFRRLKIWSAACSTGEEAYTLAMETMEVLGAEVADWQPQVLATDIDPAAVREAMAGQYSGRALANVPRTYLTRYFRRAGDGYCVAPEVRQLLTFKVLNFADEVGMAAQINMDVIFCRNVLIYFDSDFRRRVVHHLFGSLKPGGYLVIGHSESLRGIYDGFTTVHCAGTVMYQRPEA
jgi:chemotaxis protein methyltransferase CheR